ncbi:plastocyanin chloroplastic [Phtheirospermum japonicum]|uniref:Plastocyanin chloroplastic n=1 Tax=Phtheirospermum japonicum TaxID=374723 RepID=A0A830CXP0_9LAMI|nr:plastocyanin chloroplastic [Phtheirospermum japonicum]
MATITSAAVSIPSFIDLKFSAAGSAPKPAAMRITASAAPNLDLKASLKDISVAVVATAASAILATNALAIEITLGGDDESLAFIPQNFEVTAGEKIVFTNNTDFPHNVVFDEDEVPAVVDVSNISMSKGETYAVTLTEKGTYNFY